MKGKTKDIIIIGLILIIGCGVFYNWNNQNNFKKVLNNSIHSNLIEIQYSLKTINNELNNENITSEEFHEIISNQYFHLNVNAYATHKYKKIGSSLEYIDLKDLDYYVMDLRAAENLSDEEIEYHKINLKKIYNLISNISFQKVDDFSKPPKNFKQTIKEINYFSKKGYEQIKK